MHLIGADLMEVIPGEVEIRIPFQPDLPQQQGFLPTGIITTVGDSACGYAALSLMPAGALVLTVEFKMNLLAPAQGDLLVARGTVIRPRWTLTVCSGDVHATSFDTPKLVATMTPTMMAIHDRPNRTLG